MQRLEGRSTQQFLRRLGALPQYGNAGLGQNVYRCVTGKLFWAAPLALAATIGAAYTDYASARHKLDLIESDHLRTGARIELSDRELTAYAQHEAPQGVRQARLEIGPSGLATGSALVDFNEV